MASLSERCSTPKSISLSTEMQKIILNETKKLEDEHMNKFCELLKENTSFDMQTTLLYQVPELITPIQPNEKHIQILFTRHQLDRSLTTDHTKTEEGHWICSYYENNVIHIYDSINSKSLEKNASIFLKKLFPFNPKILFHNVQNQTNNVDCGIFAIAFAVSLSLGRDPSRISYDMSKFRSHLHSMLVNNVYEHFPCTNNSLNPITQEETQHDRRRRLQNYNKAVYNANRSNEKIELDKKKDSERKRNRRNKKINLPTNFGRVTLGTKRSDSQNRKRGNQSDITQICSFSSNKCKKSESQVSTFASTSSEKNKQNKSKANVNEESNIDRSRKENRNNGVGKNPPGKMSSIKCNTYTRVPIPVTVGNQRAITSKTGILGKRHRNKISNPNEIQYKNIDDPTTTFEENLTQSQISEQEVNTFFPKVKKFKKQSRETSIELLSDNTGVVTDNIACKFTDPENKSITDSFSTDSSDSVDDFYRGKRNLKSKEKYNRRKKTCKFLFGLNDIDFVDENLIPQHYIGKMDVTCDFCNSLNFAEERPLDKQFNKCCHKGKVILQEIEDYPELLANLLTEKSKYSKHFKENIRSYNNSLAFASMGAKLDRPAGRGPFVFRVHGQIYHNTFAMHPEEGRERKYGQLYVIDSKQANCERLKIKSNSKCDKNLLHDLDKLIRDINPFANAYRMMANLEQEEQIKAKNENRMVKPIYMWIKRDARLDKNRYNIPTCNEVALVFTGDDGEPPIDRDICIHPKGEMSIPISTLSANVDPMTYPILFPRGEKGWTVGMQHIYGNRNITPLQYYSYRLSYRGTLNPCLQAGNLTQQYIVDVWSKIEGERLKYIRNEQKKLRSEMYSGLMDYLQNSRDNSNNAVKPGKIVILPSSFQTSPRAYQQLYLDAMCLVQKFGKPQLFITMTCNPQWPEIQENLNKGETASDRPDLVTRVFHMKVNRLKQLLFKDQIFGTHTAYTYVIEFQKRGLPHIHLLIFLEKEYAIRNAETVDKFISAEIPDKEKNPRLYEAVKKFMVHGPCGKENANSPCMDPDTKKCTKHYPKEFSESTVFNDNSFPIYKRPDNNRVIYYKSGNTIRLTGNNYIVPYNAVLLLELYCHCNVESPTGGQWIKYLFKYCYKGHDCALVEIKGENDSTEFRYDEIHQYLSTRYVCPPEAMHRIFQFKMHEQSHGFVRLAVHLEREELIYFHEGSEEKAIKDHGNTTLTAWFELNKVDRNARKYLYVEITDDYVFDRENKVWKRRSKNNKPIISRMYFVSPKETERYHLRVLLLHVRGAQSFQDLRTYGGIMCSTFTEAARMRKLIESDDEVEKCLDEATVFKFPYELCRLFGYICVFCLPHNVNSLWIKYKEFFFDPKKDPIVAENIALKNIEEILLYHGFSLDHFNLPSVNHQIILDDAHNNDVLNSVKSNIELLKAEIVKIKNTFNREQIAVFDAVMRAVENQNIKDRYFYLDGPGGSGKSYLLNALIIMMESLDRCVISVASTGIAANLLRNGRTVHSMFKLPMLLNETSTCNIGGSSNHANLIRKCDLIIWDEITMSKKYALQAIDILLQDLMDNKLPFGGKAIVISGDWRQILPVVKHGNRTTIIEHCIKNSFLWKNFKCIKLKNNLRVDESQKEFTNWLLDVGNGSINRNVENNPDMIEIPVDLLASKHIVEEIYEKIIQKNDTRIHNYAILAPLNVDVLDINNEIVQKLEGRAKQYLSFDKIESDEMASRNVVPIEFLNSITPNGFPPHNLVLKIGAVVMLLRNLNINNGLCNGTRLVITDMLDHLLVAQIITGRCIGQNVLLPRIKIISTDNELPFRFVRKQFPLRLAYAMTINKAQGQTFEKVGIYLESKVFSHGQLYVALSRVRAKENLKLQISNQGKCIPGNKNNKIYTKNVVYKEIIN